MPVIAMPDGKQVAFPDDMPKAQIKQIIASKYPDAFPKVDPATGQPPGVPEFNPNVKGYNPDTGNVEKQFSPLGSGLMGAGAAATYEFGDEITGAVLSQPIFGLGLTREQITARTRDDQAAAKAQNPGSYLTGQIGGGLVQALASGGAGFGANAIKSGGSLARTGGGLALDGTMYGGLQGIGGGTDLNSRAIGGLEGAAIGGATGFATPFAVAGVKSLGRNTVGRLITPFGTSPERAAAAKYLETEGIKTTAGQKTGSKALRYAEGELGGQRAADLADEQARAFTDAAMRRAGGSGLADPDNLAGLENTLGAGFKSISKRNTLRADKQMSNDIIKANNEYGKVLKSDQKRIFRNLTKDVVDRFKAGGNAMSGEDYQTIRSRLSRMAHNYRLNDPEFADAIRGLRNALDNGMDRSIKPADKGTWAALRRQWGNYKVVQKASVGGGEDSGWGIIAPAKLRNAASSGNLSGFATGKSDFTKLVNAGQTMMTSLPNSGTAGRLSARSLGALGPSLIGAGAGGTYGGVDGGLEGAIAGAVGGFLAPKAVGKMLMTKAGQKYLANQLIKSGPMNPQKRALLNAVLTYSGSTQAKNALPSFADNATIDSWAVPARP